MVCMHVFPFPWRTWESPETYRNPKQSHTGRNRCFLARSPQLRLLFCFLICNLSINAKVARPTSKCVYQRTVKDLGVSLDDIIFLSDALLESATSRHLMPLRTTPRERYSPASMRCSQVVVRCPDGAMGVSSSCPGCIMIMIRNVVVRQDEHGIQYDFDQSWRSSSGV